MNVVDLTIRIADYAPVKAVLEAADDVCEAEGDAPWTLSQKIETLRESLASLSVGDADTTQGGF